MSDNKTWEVIFQHKNGALYFWRYSGQRPPTLAQIVDAMPDGKWSLIQVREVVCKWLER